MEWKQYFSREILARGMQYYKKEKVKGYIENADSCIARILGTRIYRVSISGFQSGNLIMQCTCPHAEEGNHCKHMAAVLYERQARKGNLTEEEKENFRKIRPFSIHERSVLYFNLAEITKDLEFQQGVCTDAQKMVKDHEISLDHVRLYYDRMEKENGIHAIAGGTLRNGTEQGVRISFHRDALQKAECSQCHHYYFRQYTGYYGHSRELCVHETALLYLLDEYLLKYNPGDATDFEANRFLESFGSLQVTQKLKAAEQQRRVQLVPRIVMDDGRNDLTFKIGIGKLYVVKNLTELVKIHNDLGVLSLGKNQRILFSEEDFDERSQKYFRLIEKQVGDAAALNRQMRLRHRYYMEDISIKGQIPLSGAVLDELYDLAEGTLIECQDKTGSKAVTSNLKIENHGINLFLKIEPVTRNDEEYDGIIITGTVPMLMEGSKFHYFINQGKLGRMNEEDYYQMAPLMEAAQNHRISMRVGMRHLSEFYYRILPVLRRNEGIEIEEPEAELLSKILPPEAKLSFYLDIQNNEIVLRGQSDYDGRIHSLKIPEEKDLPMEAYRDVALEQKAVEAVLEYFPQYDSEQKLFYCGESDDAVYRVLGEGVRELMQFGEVAGTDAIRRMRIRRAPQIKIGVSVESGLFDLEILSSEVSPSELLDILESYRQKKRYHRLPGGEFINLEDEESLEMLLQMMTSLHMKVQDFVKGKMHLPLYRALYVDQMLSEHEEIKASRDQYFRKLVKNFKTVKESDYEPEETLRPIMRNYQLYGYKWLRTLSEAGFGGILADDMGLGKTLQMIAVLQTEKKEGSVGPSLIVCPASLVYNWQEEIKRFAPELSVQTVTGSAAERKEILNQALHTDVLVTSYDLLKRDIDGYEGIVFRWQVLDEAQYIKNPKAAVSKAVKVIRSEHKAALTGTPIENRLSELWSIFDFLMPGFLYEYERFRQEYETPITKYKEEEPTQRLKKMVGPFILRRLKKDVLKDLPEKLEEVRYARFEQGQRELYDGQVVHMKELLNDPAFQENGGKIKVLAELTKIRQICCDPSLLVESYEGESTKRKSCMELVESAMDGGHKILIFSQFTSMLSLLETDLKEKEISYYKITGATPKQERIRLVHEFNKDETPVFLISLKAGGTGLNLTGADVVIHYDPWWNLAAQNQATDRAHRIGQTRSVAVYRLIVKDTIEEKILKMQEAKKDLADAILSGESESLTQLSTEELLELLS